MSEAIKIVVVVQGGLVQAVLSAGVPITCAIVDYDTEGADEEDILPIPQYDDQAVDGLGYADCCARMADVENEGPWVLAVHELVEKHMERFD